MPTIVLDEWIDLGVIGCRSITVTQKRNTSGNCQVVTITDAEFPQATKDEAYSHLLTAAGGTAPYTFSLVSGTLPTGTTFSGLGLLSGTPTDFGDFNLTIRVEDSAGNFCQKTIPLNVDEGAAPPDLLDSLYAVWHFESGTDIFTPDFGVAASILLADGAATTVSAGKLGNAVNINDGTAFSLFLANFSGFDNTSFTFPSGMFTFSMWVKYSLMPGSDEIIFGRSNFATSGFYLSIDSSGVLTFFLGNGAGLTSVAWGTPLVTGNWYEIVCGRDGSNIWIQVNTDSVLGTAVSAVSAAFQTTASAPLQVRPNFPNGRFQLDEFDAWDGRFLSLAERTLLWNSGTGLAYPF